MGDITRLLDQARQGGPEAENVLFAAVYDELRVLARAALWREGGRSELDASALVSEAWLRMHGRRDLRFEHRGAFFAYASRVMRCVLVDEVRERAADKRGGGWQEITFTTSLEDDALHAVDVIAVDRALQALARLDPRAHDAFEMHFFAGLDVSGIVQASGCSSATVQRDLRKARAFLFDALDARGTA